ncbi:hypothetical protein HDU96_005863 [Phlyctochytrium bullatum]|nr:hypothetical protein HDU96_005863 [Phlyctochytrium bullatum]
MSLTKDDLLRLVGSYALPVLSLVLFCVMTFISIASLIIIPLRYSRPPAPKSSRKSADEVPGVSILRPLKGVDANLKENLESSFRLDYPKFEILFSVASETDPAIQVVADLKEKYPHVDATMIIGDVNVGVNPKINNLVRSYNTAKYDIIWILDSNVMVKPHSLGRSVDLLLLPRVGLVHHIPIGVRPQGFGSVVEGIYLNTAHAKMYITINKLGVASCVVGKSNLFRKSSLEPVGGLVKFGRFMSEDNIIGHCIFSQRLRHMMTGDIAYQPLGALSLQDYFQRRARWTRIRKYTVVGATLFEPFTESLVNTFTSAYALHFFLGTNPVLHFCLQMLAWFATDYILCRVMAPETCKSLPLFAVAWLTREVTALPVYLYACAGSTVDWRGTLFRLKSDGTVEQAPAALQPTKRGGGHGGNGHAPGASSATLSVEVQRDDVYLHPLVTYARSMRMLALSATAALLFGLAYIAEMVRYPFLRLVGGHERLGAPGGPDPLWIHVAGLMTGRSYGGRGLAVVDVWHAMFVAIGFASAGRSGEEAPSPKVGVGRVRREDGDGPIASRLRSRKAD